jgi:hypothetical protein
MNKKNAEKINDVDEFCEEMFVNNVSFAKKLVLRDKNEVY